MITAVHTLIYADDADAAREFFRDVLQWPNVDAGGGWLIFRTGPSELALHPAAGPGTQHHEIALMCDDLAATMSDLESRGAEFTGEVDEERWGSIAYLKVPGAGQILIYQPKHPVAYE
ncbi:VOC family protein [Antrihabitans sp. YC2-6]|uniref:VOC family protein n=1 Tax=Antrihabitans sp. YC2-6 TaxID=2799498 RepID=UPI0018F4D5BA|nr:VOC family protein [Antrihabitans sp. YC2-6]MBJ8347719.1 VOC family protein [Antrihabitans sp. YC2-6]